MSLISHLELSAVSVDDVHVNAVVDELVEEFLGSVLGLNEDEHGRRQALTGEGVHGLTAGTGINGAQLLIDTILLGQGNNCLGLHALVAYVLKPRHIRVY